MIDLRDASSVAMTYTLFCQECEKEFGGRIELFQDFTDRSKSAIAMRSMKLNKFRRIHEKCGEINIEKALDSSL